MTNFQLYKDRRIRLQELCKSTYGNQGVILLFAGFEHERIKFRQESSFYYYTGLTDPGLVLFIDLKTESQKLYIPNCGSVRGTWVSSPVELNNETKEMLGFDGIEPLGAQCAGYQFYPFFPQQEYDYLIGVLKQYVSNGQPVFTLLPSTSYGYLEQRLIVQRIEQFMPGFMQSVRDISPLVARMRRKKDMHEIERMYKAIELTALAQEVAAQVINVDVSECEVQAGIEYIFTGSCAQMAFPSIVATGKNATVLHYILNNAIIKAGELVVVDIGAEYDYYCADITRTYPASGTFSARQKELYQLVLDTQEYIASLAAPGYWLSNKDQPEKSLNHLAKKYLAERGYANYFPHGIGHFLGLDVHDVGDGQEQLQPGDVITIEPGIYIRDEGIGIRIEDDYWIVEDGAVCLSDYIPKSITEIEGLMREVRVKQ